MELSPEEQRRIYLKEKTTFEGRQLQAARSAKKKSGRLKWLLLIIVGLMILASGMGPGGLMCLGLYALIERSLQ